MEESDSCEDTDLNMCYVCGDYGCLRHDKIGEIQTKLSIEFMK